MDLENLNQYNKRLFKKFFGIYVKERRTQLKLSLEQLCQYVGMNIKSLKAVEAGQKQISQQDFDLICYHLSLDPQELVNIGKITQVQNILNVYKEIDELYPK